MMCMPTQGLIVHSVYRIDISLSTVVLITKYGST